MMEGLGRIFDLSIGNVITNLGGGANVTGKRVSMKNASGVTILVTKSAGTATQDPILTLNSFAAASGGSAASPAAPLVSYFYKKAATAPTGAETWAKVTQTASNVVTLTGESTNQGLYAIFVAAGDTVTRSDPYLEVDIGSVAAAQNISVTFVLHDLEVQRAPIRQASSQA
jgi:hypothetical protein